MRNRKIRRHFDAIDVNGNGVLTRNDFALVPRRIVESLELAPESPEAERTTAATVKLWDELIVPMYTEGNAEGSGEAAGHAGNGGPADDRLGHGGVTFATRLRSQASASRSVLATPGPDSLPLCVANWASPRPWEPSGPAPTTPPAKLPRLPQTRDAPGRTPLRRRLRLPTRGVSLADPLQHVRKVFGQRAPQPFAYEHLHRQRSSSKLDLLCLSGSAESWRDAPERASTRRARLAVVGDAE
ncbi:hypothetical protein HD596_000274 [Nonomuraea jabiensis]|uniref:EF-hand domain-containing protein n=1 Tax=Nonomuraea jabiensis TaxID=882448 RepID=A0A7W9L7I5_9ACTN|nr:hypothetical protein [Nonomuraea jabiensis]